MNSFVLKFVFLVALCAGTAAFNSYALTGPLQKQQTEAALKQFDGGPPPLGRDIQIGEYWLSYHTVYTGEALLLALAFTLLFGKDIRRLFVGKPATTKES